MPLSRGKLLALAGFAIVYAFFLAWYHSPYAGGSDSSGYMNSARLILDGRFTTPVRPPEGMPVDLLPAENFRPLGFRMDATGKNLLPTYPPGLPLHFALIGRFTGIGVATTVVGVASALAFALLLAFTGREFGLRPAGCAAVAVLGGLSPLTILFALQPMSDLVAAVWALASLLCALRSRRHTGWAVGAGIGFAVAVLVRPTNALLLPAAVLALQPAVRTWVAFGLGGLPGAIFFAAYNHAAFGTLLASGYGDVGNLFALRHVPPTSWHYLVWTPVVATPLAVAALALPALGLERRSKLLLFVWALPLPLFYLFYECSYGDWTYLRFILPALPAVALASALALQAITFPSWVLVSRLLPAGATPGQLGPGPMLRVPLAFLLFFAAAGWMIAWNRSFHITKVEGEERTYAAVGKWVAEQLPPDGVLVAHQVSGTILYYSHHGFIAPHGITPPDFARLAAWLEEHDRVLYAVVFPHEENIVWQNLPGRWERVTQLRQAAVWCRLGPSPSPLPSPR